MERPGMVPRCFLGRPRVALVERDVPAARAQPLAYRGAREAGADHGSALASCRKGLLTLDDLPGQHLSLVSEARAFLHREAGLLERMAHRRGHAPRRDG